MRAICALDAQRRAFQTLPSMCEPHNPAVHVSGLLEGLSEHSPTLEAQGQKHYMRGGKPGFMPSLKALKELPHPVTLGESYLRI